MQILIICGVEYRDTASLPYLVSFVSDIVVLPEPENAIHY